MISQVASAQLASIRHESQHLQGGQRLVGDAAHVKLSLHLEGGEIRLHVELVRRVRAIQQEIELELVRLRPLFVVAGDDDVLSPQSLGVGGFVFRVRERVGLGA